MFIAAIKFNEIYNLITTMSQIYIYRMVENIKWDNTIQVLSPHIYIGIAA